jgi:hypothetical protein
MVGLFNWFSPSWRTVALGSIQPPTKMSNRNQLLTKFSDIIYIKLVTADIRPLFSLVAGCRHLWIWLFHLSLRFQHIFSFVPWVNVTVTMWPEICFSFFTPEFLAWKHDWERKSFPGKERCSSQSLSQRLMHYMNVAEARLTDLRLFYIPPYRLSVLSNYVLMQNLINLKSIWDTW